MGTGTEARSKRACFIGEEHPVLLVGAARQKTRGRPAIEAPVDLVAAMAAKAPGRGGSIRSSVRAGEREMLHAHQRRLF